MSEDDVVVQDGLTLGYHAVFVPRFEYAVGIITRRGLKWRFTWNGTRWTELRRDEAGMVLLVTAKRVLLLNITARLTK